MTGENGIKRVQVSQADMVKLIGAMAARVTDDLYGQQTVFAKYDRTELRCTVTPVDDGYELTQATA